MQRLKQNFVRFAAFAAPRRCRAAQARFLLFFERFWRHFTPLLLVALLFAALAWLNIFAFLPFFLHGLLLLLFAAAFAAALWFLCRLSWPTAAEAKARLERDNDLHYDQLGLERATLAAATPAALALWREHKKRLHIAPGTLRLRPPRPNIPAYDGFGGRFIVFLLFAVAFCFQSGGSGGRLIDAVYFGPPLPSGLRLDAWVSPPDYTGRPPIYLLSDNQNRQNAAGPEAVPIAVPQGSVLTVRLNDQGRGLAVLRCAGPGGKSRLQAQAQGAGSVYQGRLEQSAVCHLAVPAPLRPQNWAFAVEPDQAPSIAWLKPPERAVNSLLKLHYRIDDDYGAAKAWAEIEPAAEGEGQLAAYPYFARLTGPAVTSRYRGGTVTRWQSVAPDQAALAALPPPEPLFAPPQPALNLPRPVAPAGSARRGGAAQTEIDVSQNPWAGALVTLRLAAEDAAGQRALSAPVSLTLPQKSFASPLARALIEQRRLLTENSQAAPRVLAMLDALLLWPEKTIADKGTVLALYSLRARLRAIMPPPRSGAPAAPLFRQSLADIAAYMWAIAEGIDKSRLAEAEQRLAVAGQALREALRNGASPAEIARLMQNLRAAMGDYMAMLAERGPAKGAGQGPKAPLLSENELEKRLKTLEEAARQGKRGQSEELLAELETMLKNLQIIESEQGSGGIGGGGDSRQSQMQKQMDNLSDIMRRQQQLLDDTHKSGEEAESRPGGAPPEQDKTDRALSQRQQDLQRDLQALQQQLEKQGLATEEGLKKAERQMSESGRALAEKDKRGAAENQAQSLQALREGAQNIMGQMREALKKADEAQQAGPNGAAGGGEKEAQDPLGRPAGGGAPGSDKFMPQGEEAGQRARHILEEIRKKLGRLTPQQERDYLERLLNFE